MSDLAITQALPEFAEELRVSLRAQQRPDLASQIEQLSIVERCRCGDSFCATFYTAPPPEGAYGPGFEDLEVDVNTGWVILDLVDGKIQCVEVLFRPDVQGPLHQVLP